MKKTIIAVLSIILVVACVFGIVACKEEVDKTNPLSSFSHEIKRYYEEDFTLPSKLGNYDLEWTSNNAAITLTKRDDNWLATVNRPEQGTVEVTLKVTSNGYSKEYKTTVAAIEVSDILVGYNFPKDKATVTQDFDLDTEYTYKGKTATIVWSVDDEASKEYISISEDGKKCQVTPSALKPDVRIKATFTYNGETSSKEYSMVVYVDMSGLQLVDYWYNNTGVSIDMSGYVVLIGTAYDANYKNVTLYMVNDELTAGYYLFRVKTDDANAAKLKPGVHITVTGTTNTNYNGLIETNAGGKLVVDEDIQPIDLSTTVKAVDDLILGDLPATVYNESRLVSLSNWKIDSICAEDKVAEGANFTLMTLKKDGVEVNLRVSKYVEGAYKTSKDDAVWSAVTGLRNTYKVGDIVNVQGILTKYQDSWQIILLNATDVTAGVADADGTVYAGKTVASAVNAVYAAIKSAGADVALRADAVLTLPASNGDVAITYELCGFSRSVTVEGNTISVKVVSNDSATIQVNYKLGDFETVQFIHIDTTTEEAPAHVCGHVCPTCGKCTDAECQDAVCADKCAGHEATEKIEKVDAPFEEGKEYYLAIDQKNANKQILAVPEINSNHYGVTTTEIAGAGKVYVEKDGDNYRLYFSDGTTKSYISWEVTGKYANYVIVTENVKTWIWDAENNCFKTSEVISPEGKESGYYFIGTSGKYETVSLNYIGKVAECFPAYLGALKKVEGGDDPAPTHKCGHVCPICGKCTDANCADAVCADKCAGHENFEPEHQGTEADPYTVADVLGILSTLQKGATYEKDGNKVFYVKGYVVTGEYNSQFSNFDNFTLGDTAEATTTVVCYRPKMGATAEMAEVGNQIVLKGEIQWYEKADSKQVANGVIESNLSKVLSDADILAKELNAVADVTATVTASREISLPTAVYSKTVFAWVSDNEAVVVDAENNKLVVTVGESAVAVNVTLTITVGEATETKTYVLTLDASQATSTLAVFTFGANSDKAETVDGTSITEYTETANGYTLTLTDLSKVYSGAYVMDGTSALKLGTGSAAGSFKFTVDESVNKVVIRVTGYKANVAKLEVNGQSYETAKNEGNATLYTPVYMDIVVDTTVNKEVTFTTVTGGYRVMIDSIEFCAE